MAKLIEFYSMFSIFRQKVRRNSGEIQGELDGEIRRDQPLPIAHLMESPHVAMTLNSKTPRP